MTVDIDILKTQVQSLRGKIVDLVKDQDDMNLPNMVETSQQLENLLMKYEDLLTQKER